jgi:acyl-CoA reductase-like NAD-dependent aldehyde dehydrogenase
VTAEDSKRFISALLEKAKELKIGDPADEDTFSGPIISEANAKRFVRRTDEIRGSIRYGAKRVEEEFTKNGHYYTPAIVTGLDDDNDLMYMDSGLPILCIKTVQDMDSAMEELEVTECGLSAGIMTKDQRAVERFKSGVDVKFKFVNESSSSLRPAIYAKAEEFLK